MAERFNQCVRSSIELIALDGLAALTKAINYKAVQMSK